MYKDMNDYEIIYMVGEETDDIFNVLYRKYQPLIFKIVKDYQNYFKRFGYDIDDLMQIGYLTLYKSSRLYDCNNSSLFYTYFSTALKNAILTEFRKNVTLKKEVLNHALSLDDKVPNTDISYIDLFASEDKPSYDEYNKFIIDFKNSLSFDAACVFELYYNGYNIDEMAILLDKKKERIIKYLKEIKQHSLTYRYLFLN